jgi:hypothetical protein
VIIYHWISGTFLDTKRVSSCDSKVSIVTMLWAGWSGVRFPAQARSFSPLHLFTKRMKWTHCIILIQITCLGCMCLSFHFLVGKIMFWLKWHLRRRKTLLFSLFFVDMFIGACSYLAQAMHVAASNCVLLCAAVCTTVCASGKQCVSGEAVTVLLWWWTPQSRDWTKYSPLIPALISMNILDKNKNEIQL